MMKLSSGEVKVWFRIFMRMAPMVVFLYWMLRVAGVEIGSRDCDQCGRPTGVTWGSDAYYCSYTCASYAGDFSVRDGWKVEKLHHETPM